MIRALLAALALVALLLAVLVAARFDRGYVLIVFPPWRIEMSFILALVATFGLYVLTYIVFKLMRAALRLPAEVRSRRERRLWERSADERSRAVAALLAGQDAHARMLAEAALRHRPEALAALVAAHAALLQGDVTRASALGQDIADSEVGEMRAARQALLARIEATRAGDAPTGSPGLPQA